GLRRDAGGCRDRAVATANYDRLAALGSRRAADGGDRIATGGNLDADLVTGAPEDLGKFLAGGVSAKGFQRSGVTIKDDDSLHRPPLGNDEAGDRRRLRLQAIPPDDA